MISFEETVGNLLAETGLEATLVRASFDAPSFGNSEVVFKIENLLLRFVRDRGQSFLDVASEAAPANFYQFDELEIAMGWRTVAQILAKREPEELESILKRVRENLSFLIRAFSGDQERFTRARLEKAARARRQAFTDRLRRREVEP